jgi:PAS domain S-box-containing protein
MENIQNAEIRYRTLFEKAPDGIVVMYPDNPYPVSYNRQAYTQLGYSEEEFSHLQISDFEAIDTPEEIKARSERILREDRVDFESKHRKKNGGIMDVHVTVLTFILQGKPMFYGIFRDITERKKVEKQLKEREEKYYSFFDQSADAIFIFDDTGHFLDVNNISASLLGYTRKELKNMSVFDIVFKEDLAANPIPFDSLRAGESVISQRVFKRKNGSPVDVEVHSKKLSDGTYLGVVRDITERKQMMEELRRAMLTLQNANVELEQFAYIASHDLQEPLRTVSTFAQLFMEEYEGKLDEQGNQYIGFILESSNRMRQLIKGLLDYSRIGKEKKFVEVNYNELIANVLADLEIFIKESNAKINVQPLPVLYSNPTEIRQLFQNLINNAIKFSPKGATPEITITAEKQKDEWRFAVTDNGIGISEENRDKIFVIFKRLHNRSEYEGTGIGLSHCKKIVEQHGGKIWVESEPGKGSTFYFTIPVHKDLPNGTGRNNKKNDRIMLV